MNLRPPGYEPDELPAALSRDMVPETGVEPARDRSHRILSPGRLPIPPLRHMPLQSSAHFLVLRYYTTFPSCRQPCFGKGPPSFGKGPPSFPTKSFRPRYLGVHISADPDHTAITGCVVSFFFSGIACRRACPRARLNILHCNMSQSLYIVFFLDIYTINC